MQWTLASTVRWFAGWAVQRNADTPALPVRWIMLLVSSDRLHADTFQYDPGPLVSVSVNLACRCQTWTFDGGWSAPRKVNADTAKRWYKPMSRLRFEPRISSLRARKHKVALEWTDDRWYIGEDTAGSRVVQLQIGSGIYGLQRTMKRRQSGHSVPIIVTAATAWFATCSVRSECSAGSWEWSAEQLKVQGYSWVPPGFPTPAVQ